MVRGWQLAAAPKRGLCCPALGPGLAMMVAARYVRDTSDYGPKADGIYIVEFKMAAGEALAISVPRGGGSGTGERKHANLKNPKNGHPPLVGRVQM
jgi:hypothetical protein